MEKGSEGKILVGIPAAGPPTWGLLDSLMRLASPEGAFTYKVVHDLGVDLARNLLVKTAQETGAEWLFFLDKDAWVHPLTLIRLLESRAPIVGALCFGGSKPTTPTVYDAWTGNLQARVAVDDTRVWIQANKELHTNAPVVMGNRPPGAVVKVAATGGHCLLVKRSVFDVIDEPWFKANPATGRGRGEDLYFCHKAAQHGYQIVVDRSVVAGHMVGNVSIGCLDFLAWDRFTDWKERTPIIEEV